ncbi:MAG TPA: aminopeptidase P family N-terminal domain-containing protein, partial [Burkholderiaceae bacterium]|nr:aminopeptidase P family N-terminal domain-containing protein [Burkholderiaceae bacterium]
MDTRTSPARERIARLVAALESHGLQSVLVPSSDPHISEYLPEHWQGRAWFSGFTGSMATLVVTRNGSALFADSRYWTQAEAELAGSGIELVKIPTGNSTAHIEWMAAHLSPGQVAAVDGTAIGLGAAKLLRTAVEGVGATLRTDLDVLASAWPERAALPAAPVYEHVAPHAPLPRTAKLAQVRESMRAAKASHHFISTLDDIAWLFNLRGSDVQYNPVFLAHALIDERGAALYVGAGKVDDALRATLARDGVEVRPYERVRDDLAALPAGARLLIDPRRVTLGLVQAVSAAVGLVEAVNPSTFAKSRKTSQEAVFIREAMEEDGAAMCEFYAWFESALGRETITELTIDERLSAQRKRRPGFVSLSFSTIAGYNANGAM